MLASSAMTPGWTMLAMRIGAPTAPLEHERLPAGEPIGGGPSDSDIQEITEVDRLRVGAARSGALQSEPAGEQLQVYRRGSPALRAAR